jgi:hypothetical protein
VAEDGHEIFVSYRRTPATRERVGRLVRRLREEHQLDAWCDRNEVEPPDGWYEWSVEAVKRARRVLVVCEPEYHDLVKQRDPSDPRGRGVIMEYNALIARVCVEKSEGVAVPVAFEESHRDFVPGILNSTRVKVLDDEGYEALVRYLLEQPEEQAPPLSKRHRAAAADNPGADWW